MLNDAVDALGANPGTRVYLDGTHSAWLGVGDVADRLDRAGVARADGFFLNVSNYRTTRDSLTYGGWISQCLWYGTNPAEGGWRHGHFEYCASQYYPSSGYDDTTATDQWYLDNVTNAANPPAGPPTSRTSSSTPAATARVRGPRRPVSTPTRRTGATRPAAASASARRPTPATRWPTRSCGSRCRASPTAVLARADRQRRRRPRVGQSSTRQPGPGSRSRRSS